VPKFTRLLNLVDSVNDGIVLNDLCTSALSSDKFPF